MKYSWIRHQVPYPFLEAEQISLELVCLDPRDSKIFGARPKCGNFSQNSRWRLAAILKMNFAISSHLFVIKSHVIYLNILFWTCRIHFCHRNCFLWNLNANIQYGGIYLFRKGMLLSSISAYHQGHALLGTQQKPMDMDSFEPQISKSVMRLSSTQPHMA